MEAKYKRILLKLSGESLMGEQGYGIDPQRLDDYARQIKEIAEAGVQVGIVIGGGNIFRGLSGASKGFDRVKGDQMGMLATVINSLALNSALENIGVHAQVLTAVNMCPIGEQYSPQRRSTPSRKESSLLSPAAQATPSSQQTPVRLSVQWK